MDRQIQALLESFPGVQRREERRLTSEERERFSGIFYETLSNRLLNISGGYAVHIESINPETGKVIFVGGVEPRRTAFLTELGYQLKDGIYQNRIRR